MLTLGVNIDHVATLRQARYPNASAPTPNREPNVIEAACICEKAGARSITVHLREDRRHIQDQDVYTLKKVVTTKLNLEMGNAPEIVDIALQVKPADVCLVPEKRQEVTTEGGLDVATQFEELLPTVQSLRAAQIQVSLFIDPDEAQVRAAAKIQAPVIELHTGAYANALTDAQREAELERLTKAAALAHQLGLQANAGHGLNYHNLDLLLTRVPHLQELNIGHSIVSRAVFVGLSHAVQEMNAILALHN